MEKEQIKIGDTVKLKNVQELVNTGRFSQKDAELIAEKLYKVENIFPSFLGGVYILREYYTGDTFLNCRMDDFVKYDMQKTESIKNDRKDNKVMMELLPWPELEEIAKVYTAGAKKYGPHNWENLPDGYERYKGAMLRHLTELEKGNDIDPDTGCMHAAQIAWNAIAMLHFKLKRQ